MRKPEQKLWDTMRTTKTRPAGLLLERVENGVGAGWPDVSLRKQDWQTWIELKVCPVPARLSSKMLGEKHGLRKEQINWHLQHAAFGLFSYVLVRDEQGGLYLLPGRLADEINDMNGLTLHTNSLAWDWVGIWKEIAP